MISPINIIIGFLWIVSAVLDYSDFCYIWQLKEYRWDRFKDFLSTKQGKAYLWRYNILWRSVLLIVATLWPFNSIENLKYILIVFLVVDIAYHVSKYLHNQLRRPRITTKAMLIVITSFLLEVVLFILTRDWSIVFLLLLIRFVLLSGVVQIFSLPTQALKRYYISKATKKMQQNKHVTVVGITGSYGKSSVKVFMTHLISQKLRVVSTPKNINTEIGVAMFILKTDFTDVDVFVCEMGAYRKGEIGLICDMVKPKIGVLTVIAEQHLSLFGSLDAIQQAKYELLRAIPEDGYVVTNADNARCVEYLDELHCKQIETFGLDESHHPTALVTNLKAKISGTTFEGTYKGKVGKVQTPVLGAHHAYNIAPSIMVALYLGVEPKHILEGCQTLPTDLHGSLKIYSFDQAFIVDDSYNANPAGFRAALDVVSMFPTERRRIVVTRGLMELAEKSDEIHEQIGGEISYIADELVVITPDFYEPLKRGVVEKYNTEVKLITDWNKLTEYLMSLKETNAVILFESVIPGAVKQVIEKEMTPYHLNT